MRHSRRHILAGLFSILFATSDIVTASAASTCPIDTSNGQSSVSQTGGACTVAPGTTLRPGSTGITANNAQITANGVTVNPATNGGSTGISATGNAGSIGGNGMVITLNGYGNATGANAASGASISLTNGSITYNPGGGGNTGLRANGIGSSISAFGTILTQNGGGGGDVGVSIFNGATGLFSGGSFSILGNGGGETGFSVQGVNSTLGASNTWVSVSGGGGDMALTVGGGAGAALNNVTVSVQGASSGETGALVTGAQSGIEGTATTISLPFANNSVGAKVSSGGTLLFSSGSNILTGGTNTPALLLQSGGSAALTGGSIVTTGSNSFGVLMQGGASDINNLFLQTAKINAAANAFAVQGGIANITSNLIAARGANGILLSASQGSTVTFSAAASILDGAITTDASSTTTVSFNLTAWQMQGNSFISDLTNVRSLINFPTVTGDPTQFSNYHTLTLSNYTGAGGGVFLHTYLGNDNSPTDQLLINGGSAQGQTGLVIRNTTGPGAMTTGNGIPIVVTLNGGTTALGSFGLVNEVRAGTFEYRLFKGGPDGSDPNEWFLRDAFVVPPSPVPTPPEIVTPAPIPTLPVVPTSGPIVTPPPVEPTAGPLPPTPQPTIPPTAVPTYVPPVQPTAVPTAQPPTPFPTNPPATPTANPTIHPTANPTANPTAGPTSGPTSGPTALPTTTAAPSSPPKEPEGELPSLPIDPPPAVLPPGSYPILGPEIATDAVVQPMARDLGLATLGTLHQRIGTTSRTKSVWMRSFAEQFNDNSYRAFVDPHTTGSLIGGEIGIDLFRSSHDLHTDHAGVYGAYGNTQANVSGLVTNEAATGYVMQPTGKVTIGAYSGGAYWTHDSPGWYIDGVFQVTQYSAVATTVNANLSTSGTGVIPSVEAGFPMQLSHNTNFLFEPQVQLLWQTITFDPSNDGLGIVSLGNTSGWSGRVGLLGQWTIADARGPVWQPYLRADVWRDWGADATTVFAGTGQAPLVEAATRFALACGFDMRAGNRVNVYVHGGYQWALAPATVNRNALIGDIGLRLNF